MIETILLARSRKAGRDEVILGRTTGFVKQNEAYKKATQETDSNYESICVYQLVPVKKIHKFITVDEQNRRTELHAAQVADNVQEAPKDPKALKVPKAPKV